MARSRRSDRGDGTRKSEEEEKQQFYPGLHLIVVQEFLLKSHYVPQKTPYICRAVLHQRKRPLCVW